jgi:hypothetical protein
MVYREIKDGRLRVMKVGNRTLISRRAARLHPGFLRHMGAPLPYRLRAAAVGSRPGPEQIALAQWRGQLPTANEAPPQTDEVYQLARVV